MLIKRPQVRHPFSEDRKIKRLLNAYSKKIMKEMIHVNYRVLNTLQQEFNNFITILEKDHQYVMTEILELLNILEFKTIDSIKHDQMEKFDALIIEAEVKSQQFNLKTVKNTIINLSNQQLDENEETLLQLGLNYCPPCKLGINGTIDLIKATEIAIHKAELGETEGNMLRAGIHDIIEKYKPPIIQLNRMNWIKSALRRIQEKKNIVILNSTVILTKSDYEMKVMDLLNTPDYQDVKQEPTLQIKKTIHDIAEKVCEREGMEPKEKHTFIRQIIPVHTITPRFYGLPKTHKPNIPLRPIVDFQKSVTYPLASVLNQVLKPITNLSGKTIKNSYEFVKKIKTLRVPKNHRLVSYDVVSLFTRVPIKETVEFVRKRLQENTTWKSYTKFSLEEVIDLLKICLDATYFRFRDKTYKQLQGTPMGSPLSPVIADLCMEWIEENVVEGNSNIKFWARYRDDIFAIIPERYVLNVLDSLNKFNDSIQFTLEEEPDSKTGIPFLDVFVYRKENYQLGHKVYRKPTHTNRYLHFTSFHPRAIGISDDDYLEEELQFVTNSLLENGYPKNFISKRIDYQKSLIHTTNSDEEKETEEIKRAIIPCYGNVTDQISRYIRRHTQLEIGYFPVTRLSFSLTNVKDKIYEGDVGIYKIPCDECPAVYIGETSRDMKIRADEHKHNLLTFNIKDFGVADHALTTNHRIDFSKVVLIERETDYYRRKIKESIYIRREATTMNKDSGMKFNPIWTDLLLTQATPP